MDLTRRRFLQTPTASLAAGLAAAGSAVPAALAADNPSDNVPLLDGPAPGETRKGDMIYRPLGKTGETVSLFGFEKFAGNVPLH